MVKTLITASEHVGPRFEFTFKESAEMYITSCAPVETESSFWRKMKTNEPS